MPATTMIARYLAARERAVAINDAAVVREVDFQLARLGYRSDAPETAARAAARADAEAVPAGQVKTRRTAKGAAA